MRELSTAVVLLLTVLAVLGSLPAVATPSSTSNGTDGIQATFEDDPVSAYGTVVHHEGTWLFLWSNNTANTIVARSGPSPDDLGPLRTVLEPEGFDGQPKFSAAYHGDRLHVLATAHRTGDVRYYRGTPGSLARVGTAIDLEDYPQYTGSYRNTIVRHDGTWYVYVAVRTRTGKESVLFTGQSLTSLAHRGVVLNGSDHPSLGGLANFGAVWYDERAGTFRAFVDGSNRSTGSHTYVFVASSPDGVDWTVEPEPEIDRREIHAGFNTKHVYAPSGVWVDGTFTGLAGGSDTNMGPEHDPYDHDTTLFRTDDLELTLEDYADAEPDRTPTPEGRADATAAEPTPTATAADSPTATLTPTPDTTPEARTATHDGTGSGGPGFDVGVTLVALLAVVLLATRRS